MIRPIPTTVTAPFTPFAPDNNPTSTTLPMRIPTGTPPLRNPPTLSMNQQFQKLEEMQSQNADLFREHFEQQQQGGRSSNLTPSRLAPSPPNPLLAMNGNANSQLNNRGPSPARQHQFVQEQLLLQKQQQDLRTQFQQLQRQQVSEGSLHSLYCVII